MTKKLEAYYGLPEEIIFCKRCVMSNQRPSSSVEFKHKAINRKVGSLHIDAEGICDACRYADIKDQIDWNKREKHLIEILDKHRRNDGAYDCLVPGSGGKDSAYAAHTLKYKYDMNPLTVTWPPLMYTDYGYSNFQNWIKTGGFDNISFNQNGQVQKILTKLSIINLLHPFQTFMLGQKNLAPKMALELGIPLVFYGENEAEYGNPIADTSEALRDRSFFTIDNLDEVYLAGVSIAELLEKYKIRLADIKAYLPPRTEEFTNEFEVHYLGYYLRWLPQEAYYYASEHCGFQARPYRTQGTYSKYNSIDDKIDDLHYYTTYIKFGLGRASYDASQEVRNNHITREEAVALVHRYDGEFPDRYFPEIMEYLDISADEFNALCDKHRSPHLWKFTDNKWVLRHQVENL